MDKPRADRKKKRSKSKRKSENLDKNEHKDQVIHKFETTGVKKLELSIGTQRAIGCVIGENINIEQPWILIKKERFEDNLELHEGSSEFLPIKQEILEYPEEELLVGYDTSVIDDREEFFICLSKDGKDTILDIIEKEKRELEEKLRNCLRRTIGTWNSLGSESEVSENIIQNTRPLLEIEVESKYPLWDTRTHFSFRPVSDAIDGYIELLPGRFVIEHVRKKRVDAAIQLTAKTRTGEAQTIPTYPTNMWTEYKYEYEEELLTKDIVKRLDFFASETTKPIYNMLQVNGHIDLYCNDYGNLVSNTQKFLSLINREEFYFQDVITCKEKQVASVSWHPLMSGIVAASYRKTTQNFIYTEPSTIDEVNEIVYGENHVLIWSYDDVLKPKLYLLAPREVNYVSFCPHDGNILVGGCTNGQIVIWDNIDRKLEQVETMEILTESQTKHRLILQSKMKWMKNIENISVVLPTVISASDYSAKSCISVIRWLPTDYIITRNGKIERVLDPNFWNTQFITCSMDGSILLWDPYEELSKTEHTRRPVKRSKRLKERPSALMTDISKYKVLNKIFQPKFKLVVEDPIAKKPLPLANISIEKQNMSYSAINIETVPKLFRRTMFNVCKPGTSSVFEPKFSITSNTGKLLKCQWEGHEFDQGKTINEEICATKAYISIHDGPIKTILRSPFLSTIILTVGGKVFAVWDIENKMVPLVWRKSNKRYVSGMWSVYQSGVLAVAREDCNFEIWDVMYRSKVPSRIIHLGGNGFTDAFSDDQKLHTRKHTFCTTDSLGALKVFTYPEEYTTYVEERQLQIKLILQYSKQRREKLQKWISSWKEKQKSNVEIDKEKEEIVYEEDVEQLEELQEPVTTKRRKTEIWREQAQKGIFRSLAAKNEIKFLQLKKNQRRMNKAQKRELSIKEKEDKLLARENELYDTAANVMLNETELKEQILPGFEILRPSVVEEMKAAYRHKYKEMEPYYLQYIKQHPHHYAFEWNDMIKEGNERRRMINLLTTNENIHSRRYLQKTQKRDDSVFSESNRREKYYRTVSVRKASSSQEPNNE
ncbi:missing minor mitochondria [Carabus blaptoides fortunei]